MDITPKKEDFRVQRTKQWLYEALVLLCKERDFSTITVSLLTKKAGVSRQTFYRNYEQISDILVEKHQNLFIGVLARTTEPNDMKGILGGSIKLWYSETEFYLTFKRAGLMDVYMDNVYLNIANYIPMVMPWLEEEREMRLVTSFISGGYVMVLRQWLDNPNLFTQEEWMNKLLELYLSVFQYKRG